TSSRGPVQAPNSASQPTRAATATPVATAAGGNMRADSQGIQPRGGGDIMGSPMVPRYLRLLRQRDAWLSYEEGLVRKWHSAFSFLMKSCCHPDVLGRGVELRFAVGQLVVVTLVVMLVAGGNGVGEDDAEAAG